MLANKNFSENVVVIGATGVDDIARPTGMMRARASNPVKWQRFAGGVATNVARGISQLLSVHLITLVGNDADGQSLVVALRESDIDVAPFSSPNCSTGRYTAVLDEHGELFVGLADFQSIELLTWEHIEARLPTSIAGDASVNELQAIVLDANLSQQCISDTVDRLPKAKTNIFALTVSPAKAVRWLPVANKIHMLICNRAEASALTSLDKQTPLDQFAHALEDLGFNQFVISDGGSPAFVQEKDALNQGSFNQGSMQRQWVKAPTLPDNVDTLNTVNGAGDAMAAATIAHYLQHTSSSFANSLTVAGMPAAVAILTGVRSPLQID